MLYFNYSAIFGIAILLDNLEDNLGEGNGDPEILLGVKFNFRYYLTINVFSLTFLQNLLAKATPTNQDLLKDFSF